MYRLFTSQHLQLQLPRAHRNGCGSINICPPASHPQAPSRGHLRCWHVDWPLSEAKRQQWHRDAHATLTWGKGLVEQKKSLLSGRRGREESRTPQDVVKGSTSWVRIGPCSNWMRGSCYSKTGKKAGGKGTDWERNKEISTFQSSKHSKVINMDSFNGALLTWADCQQACVLEGRNLLEKTPWH